MIRAKGWKVFNFIVSYKRSHDGNAPTIREIGDACGISSTSVVNYYLHQLVDEELIYRPVGSARNIEIVGGYGKVQL